MLTAAGTAFLLGIIYYLAAIPSATALGLHPALAAIFAWLGYVSIAAAMLVVGAPARSWLLRRLGLAKPNPNPAWWKKVWERWGLPGLGLLAPITIGPYFAALASLTLGQKPMRVLWWISLGGLVWSAALAMGTLAFLPKPG